VKANSLQKRIELHNQSYIIGSSSCRSESKGIGIKRETRNNIRLEQLSQWEMTKDSEGNDDNDPCIDKVYELKVRKKPQYEMESMTMNSDNEEQYQNQDINQSDQPSFISYNGLTRKEYNVAIKTDSSDSQGFVDQQQRFDDNATCLQEVSDESLNRLLYYIYITCEKRFYDRICVCVPDKYLDPEACLTKRLISSIHSILLGICQIQKFHSSTMLSV
jgi:hypothetical protein